MGAQDSKMDATVAHSPTGAAARLRQGLKKIQDRVGKPVGPAAVSEDVFFGRRAPQAGSPAAPPHGCRGAVRQRAHLAASHPDGFYRASCRDAPQHIVVTCPRLARELLSTADDNGVLAKPPSETPALNSAALAHISDTTDWKRQREAVRVAVGAPATFGQRYGYIADRAASNLVREMRIACHTQAAHIERARQGLSGSMCLSIDLKPLTLNAAVEAVAGMVGGEQSSSRTQCESQELFKRLGMNSMEYVKARQDLTANPTGPEAAARWDRVLAAQSCLERTLQCIAALEGTDSTSLLRNFCHLARDPDHRKAEDAPQHLSPKEALHNAADYVVTGVQIVHHLVLMTLLHLSHDNRMQEVVRKEVKAAVSSSGAAPDGRDGQTVPFEGGEGVRWSVVSTKCPVTTACIRETMRLYPPVASLRRYVAASGGLWVPTATLQRQQQKEPDSPTRRIPRATSLHGAAGESPRAGGGGAGERAHIRAGSRITVCTVGAARAGVREAWRWNPLRPAGDGGVTQGMPYGAGPRSCPSGHIAIGIARLLVCRVVEALTLFPAPGPAPAEVQGVPADQLPIYPWEANMRQQGPLLRLASCALIGIAPVTAHRLSSLPPPTDGPEAKQRTDDLQPAFEIAGAAPAPARGFSPRWKGGGEDKAAAAGGPRPGFGPMVQGRGVAGVQRMLWVLSTPHKPEALGEYYYCPGEKWNGLPIWVSSGGRVIYSEADDGSDAPPAPGLVSPTAMSLPAKSLDAGRSGTSCGSSVSESRIPRIGSRVIDRASTSPSERLRWLIGTRESMPDNTGWLVSKRPHGGTKMPNECEEWQRYDDTEERWCECTSTKVTDHVPDGWAAAAEVAFQTDEPEEEEDYEEDYRNSPRRTRSCPADPSIGRGKREWK